MKLYDKAIIAGAAAGLIVAALFIGLLLLTGCSPAALPVQPPRPEFAVMESQSVIAPPPAPIPITIQTPTNLIGRPSDFFSATNLEGPWIYRTDDAFIIPAKDGSKSDYMWFHHLPDAPQQFFMIVPVDGEYPLPKNIITNSY